jgi:Rha family phage regulatory protein
MTQAQKSYSAHSDALPTPIVFLKEDRVFANSRDVARIFEKNHRDVLRDIDNLLESEPSLIAEGMRNFAQTPYVEEQNGQTYRSFDMDRKGFVLLAMGFTGEKALKFKIAYIDAFDAMEKRLENEDELFGFDAIENQYLWKSPIRKISAASKMIACARMVYGEEAARRLWEKDKTLPQIKSYSVAALVSTPNDDWRGCWNHLMRYAGHKRQNIREILYLARYDKVAAKALPQYGLILHLHSAPEHLVVACSHPFLQKAFAMTQWADNWHKALKHAPNAIGGRKQYRFLGVDSFAILIPVDELDNLLALGRH